MTATDKDFCVYIVDDAPAVARSLCALLGSHGYATEPFGSAEEFLDGFDPDRKACLLLDLRMPGMSGIELQARLNESGIRIPIIIVTGHGDVPAAVRAMKAGAIDFIEKPSPEDRLLTAIDEAAGVLANRPRSIVPPEVVAERLAKLTTREREVLDHLVLGKINKEIAKDLSISQRTVEIHRSRIRAKMEARGLSDLIRMLQ